MNKKQIASTLRKAARNYATHRPTDHGCCTAIDNVARLHAWFDEDALDYFAAIFKRRGKVYWWANPHGSHARFEADREARILAMCFAADMCESGEPKYEGI